MKTVRRHSNKALDRMTFVIGLALPILTIPQAYMVLVQQQTEGVSLFTWSFYLLASILFAVYGVAHRERLLMLTYFPFTLIEAAIVWGLIIH